MKSVKYCPECQEAITGRRDKTFCSSSCKSKDFRRKAEQQEAPASFSVLPVLPLPPTTAKTPTPAVRVELEEEEEEYPWVKQDRLREEALRQQTIRQHNEELHERYCQIVEELLDSEGIQLNAVVIYELLDELGELTQDYRGHPALAQADDITHERLADLYWIRDKLRELLEDIDQQIFFASKTSCFDLSKKRRSRFRQNLLE